MADNASMVERVSSVKKQGFRAVVLGAALQLWAANGALAALPKPLAQSLKSAGISESSVSIYVREVGKEKPWVDHRSAAPMNPASTMKLVTTLVGLDVLTPAYVWRTEFFTDGRVADGVLEGSLYEVHLGAFANGGEGAS
jgi:serine-type D-Ala-D-Ala carboxypeptidase/endopeptidase (penicillin-binding protein 4)